MRTPVADYLQEVVDSLADEHSGVMADYIPELAATDPNQFGVSMVTIDGCSYGAGDCETEFTIQSISKPFTYGLAIEQHGLDAVLEKIDVEPSGDAFNEISLEEETGRPRNPMINAGAIAAHALIDGSSPDVRAETIRTFYSRLANRELGFDEVVYNSEVGTAFRNKAIAYMLRTVGVLEDDPIGIVDGYTRQCSIGVTARNLAHMAATLANGGVEPVTGERMLDPATVRQVLSVMATSGMYDAAGDWLTTIGIPAKSGVAGGLIGILPGQVGIAVFSPRLDGHGNSVRGVKLFERLSRDMGLHLMEAAPASRSVVRQGYRPDGHREVQVLEFLGEIRFVEAESILRQMSAVPEGSDVIVLDLHRVHALNDVGRRMVLEGVRRLHLDGHPIRLIDPESVLADPDAGDGYVPSVHADLAAALG